MEFGSGIVLNLVNYKCSVETRQAWFRVQIAYFSIATRLWALGSWAHGARVLGTVTSDTEVCCSNLH